MRSVPESISRIAGLTLVNALVFQEVLADYEPQVQRLKQILQASDAISAFADHWEYILMQINISLKGSMTGTDFIRCLVTGHQVNSRRHCFIERITGTRQTLLTLSVQS